MANRDWSDEENRLIVADYFAMFRLQQSRQPFVKAHHNAELRRLLNARTKRSVEWKYMNISGVLTSLEFPPLDGYASLPNSQASLAAEVNRYINSHPDLTAELDALSLSEPGEDVLKRMRVVEVDPPSRAEPRSRNKSEPTEPRIRPPGFEYAKRDDANRKLGKLGESLVVELERERLTASGRTDLAARVEWTAEARGDGFGYDIATFDALGEHRYIEVKTTNAGLRAPFYISPREVEFSREQASRYELCRLFWFSTEPTLYRLRGEIGSLCQLEPLTYRAHVR